MPWFGGLILEERPDGGQEDYYAKPLSSAATHCLSIGKDKVDARLSLFVWLKLGVDDKW